MIEPAITPLSGLLIETSIGAGDHVGRPAA